MKDLLLLILLPSCETNIFPAKLKMDLPFDFRRNILQIMKASPFFFPRYVLLLFSLENSHKFIRVLRPVYITVLLETRSYKGILVGLKMHPKRINGPPLWALHTTWALVLAHNILQASIYGI